MAVTIRLRRTGRRNRPMYRVVAADSRSPRDGRFLQTLGWYRPLEKPAKVRLDIEPTLKWLKRGATPSDTVASLFRQTGLSEIWNLARKGEDYSGIELREAIKERAHKVKSKARARMKEAAGAEEAEASAKAAPAAKEAPAADAAPKTGADAAPDEKPAS